MSMETGMRQGTLVRGFGGFYVAEADGREYTLRCKKKFRRMKLSPLVGDEVRFIPGEGEEHGWLEEILPRGSECLRPPVANVSLLLIVVAPEPAPDLLLVDRIMVRARQQGMKLALVVNKCDLDPALAEVLRRQYGGADAPVYAASAAEKRGLEDIRQAMAGELCCLTGQSGVGKSTLLNALLGLSLETGEISQRILRGKNTTRHAELLMKDGLRVLDTAGFSLLELDAAMEPVALREYYPEFREHEGQCRFIPCYHDREPGCAVREACENGSIDSERLERYRALLTEVRKRWRERYD